MRRTDFISNLLKKENQILQIVYIFRLRLHLNFLLIFFYQTSTNAPKTRSILYEPYVEIPMLCSGSSLFQICLYSLNDLFNVLLKSENIYVDQVSWKIIANWYIFLESKVNLRYGENDILPTITYIWKVIDDNGASKRLILSYGFVITSNVRVWFVEKRLN